MNSSKRFTPRAAAWETGPPEIITDHWLPILQEEGLLTECPPDKFTLRPGWVPLYTKESLMKHLPAVLSAFSGAGEPSLMAGCLVRQSLNIEGKQRQLAFCPYCEVINENSDTALSHVWRHLDLLFMCGGCHTRSFSHGQALHKHMRYQCRSMMAIRDKPRSSRR